MVPHLSGRCTVLSFVYGSSSISIILFMNIPQRKGLASFYSLSTFLFNNLYVTDIEFKRLFCFCPTSYQLDDMRVLFAICFADARNFTVGRYVRGVYVGSRL